MAKEDYYPSTFSKSPTWSGLHNADQKFMNYVVDRPIRKIFDPQIALPGSSGLTLVGSGPPSMVHVNSSLVTLIRFATTNTIGFEVPIPADMDVSRDVDLRVKWLSTEAVTTGFTCLWTPLYKLLVDRVTAHAVADTAFDSSAAAQQSFGANIKGYSGWSTIAAGKLSAAIPGDDSIIIKITNTLVSMGYGYMAWVEWRYYSKLLNASRH